jgi:hypothetical protein
VANFKINKCHAFDDYTYFLYYATPVKNLEFFMNSITFGRGSSSAIIPRSPVDRRQAAPLSPVSSANFPSRLQRRKSERRGSAPFVELFASFNRRQSERRVLSMPTALAATPPQVKEERRQTNRRLGSSGFSWPFSPRAKKLFHAGFLSVALLGAYGCTDEIETPPTPAAQVKQTGQATSTAGPKASPNASPSATTRPFDSSAYGAPETTVPSNGR